MHAANAGRLTYRAKEVPSAIGVGKTKFYEIVSSDVTFPQEISLGPRARGYLKTEIEAWLEARKCAG